MERLWCFMGRVKVRISRKWSRIPLQSYSLGMYDHANAVDTATLTMPLECEKFVFGRARTKSRTRLSTYVLPSKCKNAIGYLTAGPNSIHPHLRCPILSRLAAPNLPLSFQRLSIFPNPLLCCAPTPSTQQLLTLDWSIEQIAHQMELARASE